MKIGIDARLFGPRVGGGGLGRYVEQIVLHLEKLDHENEYVIFLRNENWNDYTPTAPNFKKKLAPWRWYTLAEQTNMPRLVANYKLDLIHYPHFNVPIFGRTPFVVTIHDLNLLEYPKVGVTNLDPIRFWIKYIGYRFVLAHALGKSRAVITVSETTRQAILKRFKISPEKIMAIPLGYTQKNSSGGAQGPALPTTPYLLPTTYYLLAVGNAYPHKNLSGLLRAFKIVHKTLPDLKLVLVGPNDRFRGRIKKEAKKIGLTPFVIFTGFVSDNELEALYLNAMAYIMPSFLEGFGFPGLEAQARGVPVIASDLPVLHETFGNAAVYFNPRDPQDMALAILNLLKNNAFAETLKKDGLENIKRFDWHQTATKTLAIYQKHEA